MNEILRMIAGGLIGYGLGYILVFWLPDRRHRKQTIRRFDQLVSDLERRRQQAAGDDEVAPR